MKGEESLYLSGHFVPAPYKSSKSQKFQTVWCRREAVPAAAEAQNRSAVMVKWSTAAATALLRRTIEQVEQKEVPLDVLDVAAEQIFNSGCPEGVPPDLWKQDGVKTKLRHLKESCSPESPRRLHPEHEKLLARLWPSALRGPRPSQELLDALRARAVEASTGSGCGLIDVAVEELSGVISVRVSQEQGHGSYVLATVRPDTDSPPFLPEAKDDEAPAGADEDASDAAASAWRVQTMFPGHGDEARFAAAEVRHIDSIKEVVNTAIPVNRCTGVNVAVICMRRYNADKPEGPQWDGRGYVTIASDFAANGWVPGTKQQRFAGGTVFSDTCKHTASRNHQCSACKVLGTKLVKIITARAQCGGSYAKQVALKLAEDKQAILPPLSPAEEKTFLTEFTNITLKSHEAGVKEVEVFFDEADGPHPARDSGGEEVKMPSTRAREKADEYATKLVELAVFVGKKKKKKKTEAGIREAIVKWTLDRIEKPTADERRTVEARSTGLAALLWQVGRSIGVHQKAVRNPNAKRGVRYSEPVATAAAAAYSASPAALERLKKILPIFPSARLLRRRQTAAVGRATSTVPAELPASCQAYRRDGGHFQDPVSAYWLGPRRRVQGQGRYRHHAER